jgi:hypothetical protein
VLARFHALPWRPVARAATWLAVVLALLVGDERLLAADLDVRVRIAWGGGSPRSWQGTIRISEGSLSDPQPLGLEADAPGAIQSVDSSTLRIVPRMPRSYDGVDVRVVAPEGARLIVELTAPDVPRLDPIELPLANVLAAIQQAELDEEKNRLLAERAPGDVLRVRIARDSLVFSPGERFELEVAPNPVDLAASTTYLLTAALCVGRTDEVISTEELELKTDAGGEATAVPLSIALPPGEGVYDLKLSLYVKRLTTPLLRGKPVIQRKVQVISIAPVVPVEQDSAEWKDVYELDPANPGWWERMARLPSLRRIPNLAPQQLTSGPTKTRTLLERPWLEMNAAGWLAYPLTVETPGTPHIVEIEYPSDYEQTLGVSLIEPNAAGQVQLGLDSGFDVGPPAAGHKPAVRKHRLVVWPRSKSPWIILSNRHPTRPALVGKINVLAGPASLPALDLPPPGTGRTVAAYLDKALWPENFSATEAVDASRQPLDDWLTFWQATRRMVETLRYAGYNAVVVNVAAEGTTLYPSQRWQPTPKADMGTFFESGQDPLRKDVLEVLFRLCDRAGVRVIPTVQFATPLPELEILRHAADASSVGIEPIGADGRPWTASHAPRRGLGAYYNPLDPRVQEAMTGVIAELAERYGGHASFGGVGVQWSADSYAVLPDQAAGLDDATLARFLEEAKLSIPAGIDVPASRAAFVQGEASELWLAWRAQQLGRMYVDMQSVVESRRRGAKLYLFPSELLASGSFQQATRPRLPAQEGAAAALLALGIDAAKLGRLPGIVVPRPGRSARGGSIEQQAIYDHLNTLPELDRLFSEAASTAAVHVSEPAPLRIPEFDRVSPFGADQTFTRILAQISPAGDINRQRLIHSIARLDTIDLFDGGWLLPLGQEESLRSLVKVFRRLPAEPFVTAKAKGNAAGQGIVVRTLARGSKTYFYVVNDTPWPANVEIAFTGQSLRVQSFTDERTATLDQAAGGAMWSVKLDPFDLAGGELNSNRAVVDNYVATFVGDPAEALREQIRGLSPRMQALRNPQPTNVLANPSFEELPTDGQLPGWRHQTGPGMQATIDETLGHESPRSLHLVNRSTDMRTAAPLWVRSEPIPAPATGRLCVVAWMRVADPRQQPPLRLAIEGRDDGQVYYRFVNVGINHKGQAAQLQLGQQWARCAMMMPDLPLTKLTDVRIGFDLMGEGEVWIDDVKVYDLWLDGPDQEADWGPEQADLLKSISTVHVQLGAGQLPDCQRFLDSYWPGFLRRHVTLPSPAPVTAADARRSLPRPDTGETPRTSARPATTARKPSWWQTLW